MLEGTSDNSDDRPGSDSSVTSGAADASLIAAASEAASSAASAAGTNEPEDTPAAGGDGLSTAISDATGQPKPAVPAARPAATGEAPAHRIEAAVRNARADTLRQYGIDPERHSAADIASALRLMGLARSNPSQLVKDMAQRLGLTVAEAAAEEEEPYPEPDLRSQDGKISTYQGETIPKLLDIHGKRVVRQVLQQLAPYLQFVDSEHENRELASQREAKWAEVKEAITEIRESPYFDEAGVLKALRDIPMEERKRMGQVKSLRRAYNTYVRTVVMPGQDAAAEKRVREANERKAAASEGVHPASSAGGGKKTPLRDGDISGLAAHMERLHANGAA